MRRLIVVLAAIAAIAVADSARLRAWGPQGHRLVGQIAAARLSPIAQANVAWLLDKRSLADISSWADQNIDGNAQTAPWHYLNIPPDATSYDRDRDCPLQPGVAAGSRNDRWRDCVVDRILYSQDRLANTALDRADRAIALKYLVHFVGDLHQPFHALGVERGGNGILVNVFGSPTCGSGPTPSPCNMHGVWDSILISRRAARRRAVRRGARTADREERLESAADWDASRMGDAVEGPREGGAGAAAGPD